MLPSLRVSEALALKTSDIDWVSGKLDIWSGKGGRDRVLWLSEKKLEKMELWR